MDNLFIEKVNLGCKNSNQFLEIKKFFAAKSYYITTKRTEKKYYNTLLRSVGIKPEKIYAVEASNKSKNLNEQEYSYLETWKRVMSEEKNKNHYVLMLDDDVRFSHNFSLELNDFLEAVPKQWDILYLGASQHVWEGINIKNLFYEAHKTKGSFAIFLSPTGVQKISNALCNTDYSEPLDEILNSLNCNKYVAYPNIIITDVAYSTMRKRRNVKNHAAKMHWDLVLYDYFKYLRVSVLFVVNSKCITQSYNNITYFYVSNEANIKDNEKYEQMKKVHDVTIIHIKNTKPSYFFVEKEIKFVLKTEP